MNKLKIVAIIFLITLVSGSCKKDYPKDIPDWLKDKIKVMNKESKGKDCVYDLCREVLEYSDGVTTVYWFKRGSTPLSYTVYDVSGNINCTFPAHDILNAQCGNVMVSNYSFVRTIWKEE